MAFLIRSKLLLKFTPTHIFKKNLAEACTTTKKKGLVLGVYKDGNKLSLTPAAKKFCENTENELNSHLELAESGFKEGKSVVFWGLDRTKTYDAVAIVNLGKSNKGYNKLEQINEDLDSVRAGAAGGSRALKELGFKKIYVESFGHADAAAEGSILSTWTFQPFKSKKEDLPTIFPYEEEANKSQDIAGLWSKGAIRANSQNIARVLADMPANHMTPTIFATEVEKLFKDNKNVDVKVYDKKWIEEQKMGSFLSVSRGSIEPPVFVEVTYRGTDKQKDPIVLIGKGVTFDTGGISLKPAANMSAMRGDMGGAACLIGTLHGIVNLKSPIYVKVLIPLCDNMPSGSATKPGDVVFARNGKSICVDNTDAEGRLILADALCYSESFDPKFIVDVATLTGAVKVALCHSATGVFSNSDELYEKLQKAGSVSGDRVWRLPLWKMFGKSITSHKAYDLNNIGSEKGGGSCTAAAFLKEFVPKGKDWMHLDIAGVSETSADFMEASKGMTGRPTRTLIEFLENC